MFPLDAAFSCNATLRVDVNWIDEVIQCVRKEKVNNPLIDILLNVVSANPRLVVREGRLEALSRSMEGPKLWALEPQSPKLFPGADSTDLVLQQDGFPGAVLQFLRSVKGIRILKTEGFLQWPVVIALTREFYWDLIGLHLPPGLRAWWANADLKTVNLACEPSDVLVVSLSATWTSIEDWQNWLASSTSNKESTPIMQTTETNPLQKLVSDQLLNGLPALKGSHLQTQIVITESFANEMIEALLHPAQLSPQSEQKQVPFSAQTLLGFLKNVEISFESGQAKMQIEVSL